MEILDSNEFRTDGRKINEFRNIEIEFKTIDNKSLLDFNQGLTKIRLILLGPKSGNKRDKLQPKIKFLSFSKQERGSYDHLIDEYENILLKIFNNIIIINSPFYVELKIEIIEDNGSVLSTIINGISLILAYSGIPTKDFVISLTNGFYDSKVLCDLSASEENNRISSFTFSYLPQKTKFIGLIINGHVQKQHIPFVFKESLCYFENLFSILKSFLKNVEFNENFKYCNVEDR